MVIFSLVGVPVGASPTDTTILSLSPQIITATAANETFMVNVTIQDVSAMVTWEINLMWDPEYLECINVTEGPFLKQGGGTWWFPGTINNTVGSFDDEWGCTQDPFATLGINGSGTLATVAFKSKKAGTSAPRLWHREAAENTWMINKIFELIPYNIVDAFPVVVDGQVYSVGMVRNMTIHEFGFNETINEISFNATTSVNFTVTGATGFWNVSIPKAVLEPATWNVTLNGEDITDNVTILENATHTFIYYNTAVDTYRVIIIPEFPLTAIVPILIILLVTPVILRTKLQSRIAFDRRTRTVKAIEITSGVRSVLTLT